MTTPTPLPSPAVSDRRAEPRLDQQQVGGDHYSKLAITPWQALEAWLTPEEFRGYLKGEAIVYIARELQKGGKQDIGKARHVLTKLLEVYDGPVAVPADPTVPPHKEVRRMAAFASGGFVPPPGCDSCEGRPCTRMDACPGRNGAATAPEPAARG